MIINNVSLLPGLYIYILYIDIENFYTMYCTNGIIDAFPLEFLE